MTLVEDTDNSLLANRAGGDHVSHQGQDYHDYVRRTKAEFPPGTLVRYRGDFPPAVGVVRYTNIHHSRYISVYVFWFDTGATVGYGLAQLEKVEP